MWGVAGGFRDTQRGWSYFWVSYLTVVLHNTALWVRNLNSQPSVSPWSYTFGRGMIPLDGDILNIGRHEMPFCHMRWPIDDAVEIILAWRADKWFRTNTSLNIYHLVVLEQIVLSTHTCSLFLQLMPNAHLELWKLERLLNFREPHQSNFMQARRTARLYCPKLGWGCVKRQHHFYRKSILKKLLLRGFFVLFCLLPLLS